MNKLANIVSHRFFACIILAFIAINLQADDSDVLAQKVRFTTGRGTVYQLLQEISAQSGYSFIYDSRIIDFHCNQSTGRR